MRRKHNAPAGEPTHQPRFWIDGGDPRQTDMQEQFEQHAQNAPQSRQADVCCIFPADLAAAVLRLGWICGGDE